MDKAQPTNQHQLQQFHIFETALDSPKYNVRQPNACVVLCF